MTHQQRISQPYALAVEGKDDENFLARVLSEHGIGQVDIRRYAELGEASGGTFRDKLRWFLQFPGFGEAVKAYAVIRDADKDAKATLASIRDALEALGEPCPDASGGFARGDRRKVGVLIIPPGKPSGCLEDLCLGTVGDHAVMACAESFMDCLERKCSRKPDGAPRDTAEAFLPRHMSKAKAQAFMAGLYDVPHEVGRAAQKGYWDLHSEPVAPIVKFLRELCS